MTPGSTGAAILQFAETDGDIPFAEGCDLANMPGQIPGMYFMTGPAGPALLLVNMDIMEVPVTVPEIGVRGGLLDRYQRLFVAFKA